MAGQVVIIGGGAAGMMSAVRAAEAGAAVTLLEPGDRLGRKLNITGKGRCNLTNDSTAEEVLSHVVRNPRFLYSALSRFPPREAMAFFEDLGVPLKVERGKRVFPVSDRAFDVSGALERHLRRLRVRILRDRALAIETRTPDDRGTPESTETRSPAETPGQGKADIQAERRNPAKTPPHGGGQRQRRAALSGVLPVVTGVRGEAGFYPAEAVILATGGISYPATGSTGEGHRIAAALGHTVTPLRGSLVPLRERGSRCVRAQGLSLRNVRLTLLEDGRPVFTDFGELLFTHFGLSGPLILSASACLRHEGERAYRVELDLKPALDPEALDRRVQSDLRKYAERNFSNALDDLLPRKLIPLVIEESGIPPELRTADLRREQRLHLVDVLKRFPVEIAGTRSVTEAIVTSGGVAVSEVNPSTMESRKVRGLFFAGEILDVDACTGGYNLQIAWSTGHAAGIAAGSAAEAAASQGTAVRNRL